MGCNLCYWNCFSDLSVLQELVAVSVKALEILLEDAERLNKLLPKGALLACSRKALVRFEVLALDLAPREVAHDAVEKEHELGEVQALRLPSEHVTQSTPPSPPAPKVAGPKRLPSYNVDAGSTLALADR